MTPDICIVSHCWRYTRLAAYQLSSLVLWPPSVRVEAIVCFTRDGDDMTWPMLRWFIADYKLPATVTITYRHLPRERLMRRAIGRNEALLSQQAQIVWCADIDYVFGPGCLDWLAAHFPADKNLVWPRHVLKCSHERGDQLIEAVTAPGLYRFPFEEAKPSRPKRAVGGIQIVRGDRAREVGYLKDSRRYQKPAERWMRTKEDPVARKTFLPGAELPIPNVGRIRHSLFGREHVGCEN